MKLYFLFAFFFLGISTTQATSNPTVCTMEYAPVCGSVQVQCIKAPCNPVRETFGNLCAGNAAGATNITVGECDSGVTPSPIGGQKDTHGCLVGAGYRWNSLAKSCLRPWESKVRVMNIASEMQVCTYGMALNPSQCLQARTGLGKWKPILGGISGFDFVSGYTYRLLVLETKIENPPADGLSTQYTLIRTISKRLVAPKNDENLLGDWHMIGYNDMSLMALSSIRASDLTLNFTKDSYSAHICNTINAKYTTKDGVIASPYAMSTKMACANTLINTMEPLWDLNGATYSIKAVSRIA